jgi:hypothetical protein
VRLGTAGPALGHLIEQAQRLFVPAGRAQGQGQVPLQLVVVRGQPRRFAKGAQGARRAPVGPQHHAEVAADVGRAPRVVERPVENRHGLALPSEAGQGAAEPVQRGRVIGPQAHGLPEGRLRILVMLEAPEGGAQRVMIVGVLGTQPHGLAADGRRLGEPVGAQQRPAEDEVVVGVVR